MGVGRRLRDLNRWQQAVGVDVCFSCLGRWSPCACVDQTQLQVPVFCPTAPNSRILSQLTWEICSENEHYIGNERASWGSDSAVEFYGPVKSPGVCRDLFVCLKGQRWKSTCYKPFPCLLIGKRKMSTYCHLVGSTDHYCLDEKVHSTLRRVQALCQFNKVAMNKVGFCP